MQSVGKIALLTHTVISLLLAAIFGGSVAYFFSGGLVLLFAMFGTALIFDLAVNKKRIALATLLIVSKYTILGYICWYFSKFPGSKIQWTLGSVFSLVIGFTIYAFIQQKRQEEEEKCLSTGHN